MPTAPVKSKTPLRAAIITVVAVVVVVFLLPAAFWFYNWQNDRVGIGGKTRTVIQMEQSPLVAPEVAGLKRLKIEHSEPAGLGMYNGNEVTAWYRPPQGQTPTYLRKFIKLAEAQGFIHANPPDENSAVMEHPGTRQKLYLDIVSAENQSWQDPSDYGTICVLIEGR